MSRLPAIGRRGALLGAAAGVAVAGAAVGLAAERYAAGRSWRGPDPMRDEPLGLLSGDERPVTADDGTRLHVEVDEGEGGGDVTVLLSHGLALEQGSWHFQRRDLRSHPAVRRLVLWDQRGHGRSGRGPDGALTIDQLGRDLERVLEATAPDGPVVLVGHSMGGMTVMSLADRAPQLFGDRVIGVALVATSPGRLAEVSFGAPAAAARALRRSAPRALAGLHRRPTLVTRGRRLGADVEYVLTKRYSFATDVPPSLVRFVTRMHDATGLDVLAELFPAFDAHDKLDALGVLDGVETLVLGGEDDLITPVDHSRAIAERLPGAELVVVPDAGHLVMLEHHEVVTRHLAALVERALRSLRAA
jgi:pimeloyl-ACP methyl ester carboxylesterase